MGGMAEVYREIHKKNIAKIQIIADYVREKCIEADLPVTGVLNEHFLLLISDIIYRNLLKSHNHNEFTPIEDIMTTVRNHINVIDCFIFTKLQEIHANIHLAGVWHNEHPYTDLRDDTKIEFRRKLLALLEERSSLPLQNGQLPSRQVMLHRLEECYDCFNDPATQQILKDNIKIDLFTAIKQGLELLCSAFLPLWTKAQLKGFSHLFNTVNDARVSIVQASFERDDSHHRLMRCKVRNI